jgi:3-dehydroquinate dehydratase/shikimate dehydrogenase
MRRLQKDERPEKVCIPIVEMGLEKALTAIRKSTPLADLIELRVDYMRNPELPQLLNGRRKPFIVTNRRREEGGRFQGDEGARVRILEEAVRLDVDYVDIEMGSERALIQDLMIHKRARKRGTKIILSFHDVHSTPPRRDLQKRCNQMSRLEADVVKIVTFAQSWEDNLNVLALIPYAKERGQKIIAFCMGEKGKMSRVIAPLVGAAWTYASSITGKASAPGQITVREMRRIWEGLR